MRGDLQGFARYIAGEDVLRIEEETYTSPQMNLGSRVRINGVEFELIHQHWDGLHHTAEYRPVPHRDPWNYRAWTYGDALHATRDDLYATITLTPPMGLPKFLEPETAPAVISV